MEKTSLQKASAETSFSAAVARVCIVTPVYNGSQFIDSTIQSLVSQAGDFVLRLHVQDGGSTDDTLEKLAQWRSRLARQDFPRYCRKITFTFASSKDSGMYDAINKGFAAIKVNDRDILTWLNSDDLLVPGAIEFVRLRMVQFPQIQWICSRPCECDGHGVMRKIHAPQSYSQRLLAAGLHDSRHLSFVMQEGSFWTGSLWRRAKALRPELRLAGDYDLWRRFAAFEPLYSCEQVLAMHRRHASQLSAQSDKYLDEIDRFVLTGPVRTEANRNWNEYRKWVLRPEKDDSFAGNVIMYYPGNDSWGLEKRHPAIQLASTLFVRPDGSGVPMLPVSFADGFGGPEGPYPHLHLPEGFRFALPGRSGATVQAASRGSHWLLMHFRNFTPGLELEVTCAGRQRVNMKVPVTEHHRNGLLAFSLMLRPGANQIMLDVRGSDGGSTPGLLVLGLEALPAEATLPQ